MAGESGLKGNEMHTLRRVIAQLMAPYSVEFRPQRESEKAQLIYSWTLTDATDWAAYALNSDSVVIRSRIKGQVLAVRNSIA